MSFGGFSKNPPSLNHYMQQFRKSVATNSAPFRQKDYINPSYKAPKAPAEKMPKGKIPKQGTIMKTIPKSDPRYKVLHRSTLT